MKRVGCVSTVCGGIGQRRDDLVELDDRAGPAVRDDERQRSGMSRAHVDEVDVDAVDGRDELGQVIELAFRFAPIVGCRPIAHELADAVALDALRSVRHRFLVCQRVASSRRFSRLSIEDWGMSTLKGRMDASGSPRAAALAGVVCARQTVTGPQMAIRAVHTTASARDGDMSTKRRPFAAPVAAVRGALSNECRLVCICDPMKS